MNYLEYAQLLPILGKHASVIQALSNVLPELENAWNEAQPHINALNALALKDQSLINKLEAMTPQIQSLVNDILPVLQQASK
jgi:hypothetical protein